MGFLIGEGVRGGRAGFKLLGPGDGLRIIEIRFSSFNNGIGFRINGGGVGGGFSGGVADLVEVVDIVENLLSFGSAFRGSRLDLRFGCSERTLTLAGDPTSENRLESFSRTFPIFSGLIRSWTMNGSLVEMNWEW